MTLSNTASLRIFLRACSITALASLALITGCATRAPGGSAPVEDRGTMQRAPASSPVATAPTATPIGSPAAGSTTAVKPLPGAENAGKPGYYTIRPGDTLIRIGLESGQSWRDIARWNGIDNPNVIEVGQVVRIIPPGTAAVAAAPLPSPAPAPASDGVVTRPVTSPSSVTATSLPAPGTRTAATPSVTPLPAPAASAPLPPASSPSDEDIGWIWPVTGGAGNVIATFDEVKNKGVGIGGKLGDSILAAGDGRVVYAGAGLRGYGNLIILKHNNTYLTAYAHNQTLLVKEDQTVRKGQKIAEMGNSDADRTKLHFEIRRQGKPVDPLRFLPAR
ncbi:peptidoglycan DD-metalloendopeptidase family protein [Variovorax sp. PCZ-1]|uniref:peptidoglycan DD-metalloendopeptidase family protein n=1 Tax=Variovorax sp. PCZ-1 TaxID=2835533 RepID=UPI001BD019A4|nr:peptidoglycan DD-metalloendopeptidase family protein [Variovorax sp. PCZ-1]MBS7808304.1 peptidoglycan DD-metalloendopeptidase family protein [Variovorax sp. PCZ-1]